MRTNIEVVQSLYEAFAAGDMDAAAAVMAPDMRWNEAENYRFADRNPYVGAQAVFEGVFGRTAEVFDDDAGAVFGQSQKHWKGSESPDRSLVHLERWQDHRVPAAS